MYAQKLGTDRDGSEIVEDPSTGLPRALDLREAGCLLLKAESAEE